MGSLTQHQQKAEHIQRFADAIRDGDHPEWVVIALFYRALHCIEMMLAAKSKHTTSHEQRRIRLKRDFSEMLRYYKPIYNYSLVCRYRFQSVSAKDIAEVEANLQKLSDLIATEMAEG